MNHDHSHHQHRDGVAPTPKQAQAVEAAQSQRSVEYTCPMHPQIRQMGPGNCPICGMALEPVVATRESGPSPELKDFTRRFWVGLLLTLPVLVLEMGAHVVVANALRLRTTKIDV